MLALLVAFATMAPLDALDLRQEARAFDFAPADAGTGGEAGIAGPLLLLAEEPEEEVDDDDPTVLLAALPCAGGGAGAAFSLAGRQTLPRRTCSAQFSTGPPSL